MSATDELRRLLDERGWEYTTDDGKYLKETCWAYMGEFMAAFVEFDNGETRFELGHWCFTPEQAIAATLGNGECTPHGEWESISQTQEVRHVFCDCGYELGMDERDSWPFKSTRLFAIPNFCQECGRKIRKAVNC